MTVNTMESEGWTKRNVADEPRLSELINLYEELDFEVIIKDASVADNPDDNCKECIIGSLKKYKVIYTRPKQIEGK